MACWTRVARARLLLLATAAPLVIPLSYLIELYNVLCSCADAAEHGQRWLELGLSPSQLEQHVPHPAGYDMALVRASRAQQLAPTHPRLANMLDWRCDILGEEHYDVFLSYRWVPADQQLVKYLYDHLRDRLPRLRVFWDHEALHPGGDFVAEFVQALGTCRVFVPVVSAHPHPTIPSQSPPLPSGTSSSRRRRSSRSSGTECASL